MTENKEINIKLQIPFCLSHTGVQWKAEVLVHPLQKTSIFRKTKSHSLTSAVKENVDVLILEDFKKKHWLSIKTFLN